MTGADMDHLTVTEKGFNQMRAVAVVTAGVCSNAQRMSRDTGNFYEPGTINIMVMTNMRLSHRAMARAVITVTEAKTAALTDLDIRSSFQGIDFQATGTGTDNIIIVQGQGVPIDNTGGHSKMGELIAKAVHQGSHGQSFSRITWHRAGTSSSAWGRGASPPKALPWDHRPVPEKK